MDLSTNHHTFIIMLFTKECFQENPFGVINLALHLKILFKKFSQQHTGYYLVIFLKILSQLSIIFFPIRHLGASSGHQ
jgi:hypothetical protein